MSNQPEWALASLDDLRAFIGDKVMQGPNITTFELLIKQISAFMERYTHRKLKARDYSYLVSADEEDTFYDGDGTCWLHTKQWPINSITTLIIGDTTVTEGDWDTTGYIIYKNQGRIYYENGFDSYRKNVKLIYNAGYETDTVDYADLNLVCCLLCKYIWDNKGKLGLKSEFLGRYRYVRGNFRDTDRWVFETLDRYQRGSFSRYVK
jgi:hypothetical protein